MPWDARVCNKVGEVGVVTDDRYSRELVLELVHLVTAQIEMRVAVLR